MEYSAGIVRFWNPVCGLFLAVGQDFAAFRRGLPGEQASFTASAGQQTCPFGAVAAGLGGGRLLAGAAHGLLLGDGLSPVAFSGGHPFSERHLSGAGLQHESYRPPHRPGEAERYVPP